ncbi:hypothetical protein H257_18806 [Aphanomyces astaci]|uniref:Chromo domain-containing protein n=1 Tax=Aphanomyces astaci TaxID=112090 RepID=W4FBI9_APHAT|nr:hypothetical protein H257_18806 [Aphanomyces astaci]ETV64284.1 hypothetical protein H257_18806 [Aphanomyces astaci]|eukprot:XP_009846234.1 hypothetical protein H257_18806 [Aphanomyces astaci]
MYHEGGREVTEHLEAQIAFGDGGFHVERLDEARCVDGQHQVLVKWLGLDDEESSWEPAANFLDDIPVVFRKWAAANKEYPAVAALIKTLDFPQETETSAPSCVRYCITQQHTEHVLDVAASLEVGKERSPRDLAKSTGIPHTNIQRWKTMSAKYLSFEGNKNRKYLSGGGRPESLPDSQALVQFMDKMRDDERALTDIHAHYQLPEEASQAVVDHYLGDNTGDRGYKALLRLLERFCSSSWIFKTTTKEVKASARRSGTNAGNFRGGLPQGT